MLVKFLVFSSLFGRIEHFAIYVITGNLLFFLMSGATSRSLNSVIGNAGLLRKIYIPKYVFTLATVTSELVTFFFSLGALVIVIIATGVPFSWNFFLIIIPIMLLYIFCIGLGLFLAQAMVFFRDTQQIWGVITLAWMFLSAIFYPVDILPEPIYYLVTNYNPMYFYITMFRSFVMDVAFSGTLLNLMIRGAIASAAALLLGLVTFSRSMNRFYLHM